MQSARIRRLDGIARVQARVSPAEVLMMLAILGTLAGLVAGAVAGMGTAG